MRLTIVHLLQVKRREAEDDGEDEEGSGARLVSSSAALLLDHVRPDLFQVEIVIHIIFYKYISNNCQKSKRCQGTFGICSHRVSISKKEKQLWLSMTEVSFDTCCRIYVKGSGN